MKINFKKILKQQKQQQANKTRKACFRVKLFLIKTINTQINPTARQGQNKAVTKRITKIK